MLEPARTDDVLHLRRDLVADGYTDRDIKAALRTGRWVRVRTGAYARRDHWESLDPAARHMLVADAVTTRLGDPVALSHQTALAAHGLVPDGVDLDTVHVIRLDDGAGRSEAGITHHRTVQPGAVPTTRHDGRLVVVPGYALRQIACGLDRKRTLALLDATFHAGLTDAADQARWEPLAERWPGAARFRLVLPHADPRVESVAESYVRWICLRFGLPMPDLQVEVVGAGGRTARADFSWLQGRLLGEFDGKVKFVRHLREGETVADAAMRERRREGRVLDAGSAVVRFQWRDVLDQNEKATAARIATRLEQARALPLPPWAR